MHPLISFVSNLYFNGMEALSKGGMQKEFEDKLMAG